MYCVDPPRMMAQKLAPKTCYPLCPRKKCSQLVPQTLQDISTLKNYGVQISIFHSSFRIAIYRTYRFFLAKHASFSL